MSDNPQYVLNYFGLNEHPFAATADPAYFFATKHHRECLYRLWNHIDGRQGIAVVLGNYGTGKTTLLRKLLTGFESHPEKYNAAVIASPLPTWTSYSLLENIIAKFQLKPTESTIEAFINDLNRYLLVNRQRINTLIIDDAQNLNKREQLELPRLAQNLETRQHKLLNLVFFAQLEWIPILQAAPNFMQRINITFTLQPIGLEETGELIAYRLRAAGAGEQGPVFEESAIQAIHAYSGGNPRLIVTLCRNAMFAAARMHTRHIGQAIILHTIETTMPPEPERLAQVTSSLSESSEQRVSPLPENLPEVAFEPRQGLTRQEARANRILMKAIRATRRPSPSQEKK